MVFEGAPQLRQIPFRANAARVMLIRCVMAGSRLQTVDVLSGF